MKKEHHTKEVERSLVATRCFHATVDRQNGGLGKAGDKELRRSPASEDQARAAISFRKNRRSVQSVPDEISFLLELFQASKEA